MTGIEDRIEEMREMAAKFQCNEILPDCPNLAKMCTIMRETLLWIKEHDERRRKLKPSPGERSGCLMKNGEAMPTTEKLACALETANGPQLMIKRARAGYYDDFKSELASPIRQLVRDLLVAELDALANRAMAGDFDGTKEEAEAWFAAEGKRLIS